MPVYFDTSLLVKLYTPERDSAAVLALVASLSEPIYFTTFQLTEFVTALECKKGRQEIAESDVQQAMVNLMADYQRQVFIARTPPWEIVFRRTGHLARAHAAATFCRTLDAMHVGLAMELQASAFATNDHRQKALAMASGLKVLPL